MAEHENSIGASDDWHTPQDLLDSIGLFYDLDPCAPITWRQQLGITYHVQARTRYTIRDNGLAQDWRGKLVFLNPPFGGRLGHVPWIEKYIDEAHGLAVCRAYTSAGWWHDLVPQVDGILFPRGKTKFIRPDGSIGKAPGHGITLLAIGPIACRALETSGQGIYIPIKRPPIGPPPLQAAVPDFRAFIESNLRAAADAAGVPQHLISAARDAAADELQRAPDLPGQKALF